MTTTQSEYYKKTIAKSVITGLGDCAFKVSCTLNHSVLEPILKDLDVIWELRHFIPDPTKTTYCKAI